MGIPKYFFVKLEDLVLETKGISCRFTSVFYIHKKCLTFGRTFGGHFVVLFCRWRHGYINNEKKSMFPSCFIG